MDNKPKVYAGFWIRALALAIDILILFPLVFIIEDAYENYDFVLLLVGILPLTFYKPLLEWRFGATIGKMLCRIRVEDKEANRLKLESAIIRSSPILLSRLCEIILDYQLFNNANYINADYEQSMQIVYSHPMNSLANLISIFMIIDILFIFVFRAQKRTLHDLMAGSYCVRTNVQVVEIPPPLTIEADETEDSSNSE